MSKTERKFVIKNVFGECILSKNEYNSYSFRSVMGIFDKTILFFQTKQEAENYIYEHDLKGATILEVFA